MNGLNGKFCSKKPAFLGFCLSLVLAACATKQITTEYCTNMALEKLASEHVSQGLASAGNEIILQCADHGVHLNVQRYQSAYDLAQENFCKNTEAFYYGYHGNKYEEICPEPVTFDRDYSLGKTIFDLQLEIWNVENKLKQSSRDVELYASSSGYAGSSRVDRARKDIRDYKAEIGRLRIKLFESRSRAEELGFELD